MSLQTPFEATMTEVGRHFSQGEHEAALALARSLVEHEQDPVNLGWAKDYELRCLYGLERWTEGLQTLRALHERPVAISVKNEAWLWSVGAEMALRGEEAHSIGPYARRAFELRCLDGDRASAAMAAETASALLRKGGSDGFGAWFDAAVAWARTLPPGSSESMTAHMALSETARAPWFETVDDDVRAQNRALHTAAGDGDVATVKRLLARGVQGGAWCAERPGMPTPLHAAAYNGHAEVVALLLYAAVHADVPNCQGRTALHHAADQNHAGIVRMLCGAGASTEHGDMNDLTALHIAGWQGHLDAVDVLLAYDAPLEARDRNGDTPLAIAASEPVPAVVETLLDAGAALESCNDLGQTPLMRAAMEGRAVCIALLLDRGAKRHPHDVHGLTAAQWAAREGFDGLL